MKMVEEDTADDDDDADDEFAIDWSETAYILPDPDLISEKSFNEHIWNFSSYKDYFNYMRDSYHHSTKPLDEDSIEKTKTDQHQLSQQPGESMVNEKKQNKKADDTIKKEHSEASKKKPAKKSERVKSTMYHKFLAEPRSTNILAKDRRFYHAFMKNSNRISEKKENQVRMQKLLVRIRAEQDEYQQFLHHAASINMQHYLYLGDDVKNAIISNIHDSISSLLQQSQKMFKPLRVISFEQLPTQLQNPVFTFIRSVYEQGAIPKFNMPKTGVKLSSDATTVLPKKKGELSDDKIHAMCMKEAAHVYMESDVLLAIMEGLVVNTREWLLPVKVNQLSISDGQIQTVLIFGNPLPRRVLTTREVNKRYYESALETFLDTNIILCEEKALGDVDRDNESTILVAAENKLDMDNKDAKVSDVQVNLFSLNDINILLETRIDQCDDGSNKSFHVSPKCEYQISIGFEQFSILDLCQLWWRSKISNTDWIVCSRVDIRNDTVSRNDTYTRDVLCPPTPQCPYNPNYFCNHLYFLLKELLSLNPGEYLLDKCVGNSAIHILGESESGCTYEMMYKDVISSENIIVDNVSPWLPIDTTVLPEIFVTREWLSCLFSMKRGKKNPKRKQIQVIGPEEPKNRRTEEPIGPVTNRIVMSYEDDEF